MTFDSHFMKMQETVQQEFQKCFQEAVPMLLQFQKIAKEGSHTRENKFDLRVSDLQFYIMTITYEVEKEDNDSVEDTMEMIFAKMNRPYTRSEDLTRSVEVLVIQDQVYEFPIVFERIRESEDDNDLQMDIHCCSKEDKLYKTIDHFKENYLKERFRPIYEIHHYHSKKEGFQDASGSLMHDIYYYNVLKRLLMDIESIKLVLEEENLYK